MARQGAQLHLCCVCMRQGGGAGGPLCPGSCIHTDAADGPPLHAQGDAFGCPYKTLSPGELADALRALRLPPAAAQQAAAKARGGHFQLACMAAWEGAHGCACDTGVNHPNQVRPEALKPKSQGSGLAVPYVHGRLGGRARLRVRHRRQPPQPGLPCNPKTP